MECGEVVKFKKVGRLAVQGRKRNISNSGSDEEHDEEAGTSRGGAQKFTKAKTPNALVQTTKSKNRSNAIIKKLKDADDEDSDGSESAPNMRATIYKASKSTERIGSRDMGATATLDIETEQDKDAQAQFERVQSIAKEVRGKADDKVYRGINAYGQFFEKKDTAIGNASSGLNRKGPIRAPNFVRQSVRWDYQPDICKDYKETGFCGFGDSCKFLHDRSDYKHGWEIEREWKEGRYGKGDADPHKYEISDEDENELPFKCVICRQSFVDPVVTKCKHYFCEKCAIEQFKKTHKCYVCEKGTSGIFNPAKDVIAKMKGLANKQRVNREESESSTDGHGEEEEHQTDTPMERLEEEKICEKEDEASNSSAYTNECA